MYFENTLYKKEANSINYKPFNRVSNVFFNMVPVDRTLEKECAIHRCFFILDFQGVIRTDERQL